MKILRVYGIGYFGHGSTPFRIIELVKNVVSMIQEIAVQNLNPDLFINEKVTEIINTVGGETAINALSGGVDSSTVTMLGHRALGNRLKTVFIENGIMRAGEPEQVVGLFQKLGVTVEVVDAKKDFFAALR